MRAFFVSLAVAALAACSAGPPPELTASLASGPPAPGHEIGGSIDIVKYDEAAGRLEISGWHMLTPKTKQHDLKIYASNALSVESVTRRERADVVTAIGDEDLANSGFTVVLKTEPGTPLTRLCISTSDKHYGDRLLNAFDSNQPQCSPAG